MRRTTLLLALLALASSTPALAQLENPFRDLVHARSMAMGGAYRAFGLGLESVVGNPAAMSLYQRYDLELSGAWDFTQRVAWAAAGVMDSTNKIAAGVAYHLVSFGEFENRTLAHLNTIALSTPLISNVYLGLAAHYLFASGAINANAVTGDVGVVVKLLDSLSLGLAGHNLIDTNHPELSTYFTLSGAFTLGGMLSLVADARGEYRPNEAPLLAFNAGGELILGEGIPLRAGWALDERGHTFLSGGLGYMFEGGAVDVAYRHELNGIGRAVAVTIKVST